VGPGVAAPGGDRGPVALSVAARPRRVQRLQAVRTARSAAIAYAGLAETFLRAQVPTTAYDTVLSQVRPDGTVSKPTALQAFALSYGSLPGVHVPSGPRGAVESGDLAGGWVLARLPRLSPRLRNAIFRGLDLAPPRATAHSGETARTAGLPDFGDANFHPSGALTAAADHWATVEGDASHLNHTLALMIVAGTENITSAGDAYARRNRMRPTGHQPERRSVRGTKRGSGPDALYNGIHQFTLSGIRGRVQHIPPFGRRRRSQPLLHTLRRRTGVRKRRSYQRRSCPGGQRCL
jgi:hypothetical protein